MTPELHPLAAAYLERLRHAATRLPATARADLLADVEAHLAESTSIADSDATVLNALDRLGDPEEIVTAQAEDTTAPTTTYAVRPSGPGPREWVAIFMLLFGGFFMGVGWVIGVVLLWSSTAWRTREKWLGTLIWPGGFAVAAFGVLTAAIGGASSCEGTSVSIFPAGGGSFNQTLSQTCSGGASTPVKILLILAIAVAVFAPILTAIHLARHAYRDGAPDR